MKTPATTKEIPYIQRFLRASGLYKDRIDGIWGKNSREALEKFERMYFEFRDNLAEFDTRSESNIKTLTLTTQVYARLFLLNLRDKGWDVRIISGTRTYDEQNALYAQGRTVKGAKVTNAKAGESWHNFGLAWDVGIFRDGGREYVLDVKEYAKLAQDAKLIGIPNLVCGIDWKGFPDPPHYHIQPSGWTISSIKEAFDSGLRFPT